MPVGAGGDPLCRLGPWSPPAASMASTASTTAASKPRRRYLTQIGIPGATSSSTRLGIGREFSSDGTYAPGFARQGVLFTMHDVSTPKLWKETLEEHRRDVRAAILEAAWTLAQERGVRGVAMGLVAEQTGIGRATLYRYFPSVVGILFAAHEDHVARHLASLAAARSNAASNREALLAMRSGYAMICFHRNGAAHTEVHGLVHAGPQHARNPVGTPQLVLPRGAGRPGSRASAR